MLGVVGFAVLCGGGSSLEAVDVLCEALLPAR